MPTAASRAPIIVLTLPHSGAEVLRDNLASSAAISCTERTGLLPMCESVASTWRQIERRAELTALAMSSIRALVTSMAATRTATTGAPRWCETAISGTGAASTFLKVFPEASFICLHRRCDAVVSAAMRAYPRAFADKNDSPDSPAGQDSAFTVVCAQWAESTRALLDFQLANPQSSLRLRREDLDSDAPAQMAVVWSFLGITAPSVALLPENDHEPCPREPPPRYPVDRLSPPLRAAINDLHVKLGYPPF
jgi:hypothetical protein